MIARESQRLKSFVLKTGNFRKLLLARNHNFLHKLRHDIRIRIRLDFFFLIIFAAVLADQITIKSSSEQITGFFGTFLKSKGRLRKVDMIYGSSNMLKGNTRTCELGCNHESDITCSTSNKASHQNSALHKVQFWLTLKGKRGSSKKSASQGEGLAQKDSKKAEKNSF